MTAGVLVRVFVAGIVALAGAMPLAGHGAPEDDRRAVVERFQRMFPGFALEDYTLGAFMFSPDARRHFEDIMAFPPFEVDLDRGRRLWETPFANGRTYAQCLPQGGRMIAGLYPQFDPAQGRVVTFEDMLNRCRRDNGETEYRYDDRETLGILTAYARTLSDGMPMQIRVEGPAATAKYEAGKALFHRRIGQMNFACSTCHIDNAGRVMRMETISPALGQATHFPVFRGGDALYTLHARYTRCMEQVRAQPFPMGSEAFNNLEYFHSFMSNGLPLRASVYRR